jgi:EAL domain-containing protein (putative c-di-GMP-specific phosphodiesterase class I)
VVAAAHSIDLRVVALGVEDEVAVERARDAGFDLAQGFFFHRPAPPAYVDGLFEHR